MAVTLSPWPAGDPDAFDPAEARAALQAVIGSEVLTDARLDALGAAASALVERFAPGAPPAIRNEAVLRLASYIHAREPKAAQMIQVAAMRFDFRERFYEPSGLVNSGAASLLLPWRSRRALPVEEAST